MSGKAALGKPFAQSFWVREGLLCAGHYPGSKDDAERDAKLAGLIDHGICRILSLMEPDETSYGGHPFAPYTDRLAELALARGVPIEFYRHSIRDAGIPTREQMTEILDLLDRWQAAGLPAYVHCWGGHGRTGTVVACHLIRRGNTAREAMETLMRLRSALPKNHDPFEGSQREFVLSWQG